MFQSEQQKSFILFTELSGEDYTQHHVNTHTHSPNFTNIHVISTSLLHSLNPLLTPPQLYITSTLGEVPGPHLVFVMQEVGGRTRRLKASFGHRNVDGLKKNLHQHAVNVTMV